jgi:hypothetical protein
MLAVGHFDFEKIASSVILDRDDFPDFPALASNTGKSDQVGVIIFALFKRRESRALDLDQRPTQGLGSRAIGDSFDTRDRSRRAGPNALQLPFDSAHEDGAVSLQVFSAVREQLQAQFAPDAMRSGDGGKGDALRSSPGRGGGSRVSD